MAVSHTIIQCEQAIREIGIDASDDEVRSFVERIYGKSDIKAHVIDKAREGLEDRCMTKQELAFLKLNQLVRTSEGREVVGIVLKALPGEHLREILGFS